MNISKTIAFSCAATDEYYIDGIHVACKPIKYLGAFLGYGDLTKLNFEIPLKKVQNKIQCWNKQHLTLPAQVTVIKTFLLSVFIHILNTVYVTNDQIGVIQDILNNFLWKGRSKM